MITESGIRLFVEPLTVPMPFEVFRGPYKLAIDGYCSGPPRIDLDLPSGTLNHHENVEPWATRSTSGQAQMCIRQGLFTTRFRDEKGPRMDVYANDPDQDVCTTWAQIKWHWRTEVVTNPLLNRLVDMEDKLDCTAGAYRYPLDSPMLRAMAWVFEDYTEFRLSGELDKKDARAYRRVIDRVVDRIEKHIHGDGEEIPLDIGYDTLGYANGWTIVRETGAQARTKMLHEGFRRVVSVRQRPDGRFVYSILKFEPFEPLDLLCLARALNLYENRVSGDLWGGRPNVIGSPRVAGTDMNPDQMARFLETYDPRAVSQSLVPLPPAPVGKATFSLTTEVITRLEREYGTKGRSAAVDNILRGSLGMPPRPPVAVGSRFKANT